VENTTLFNSHMDKKNILPYTALVFKKRTLYATSTKRSVLKTYEKLYPYVVKKKIHTDKTLTPYISAMSPPPSEGAGGRNTKIIAVTE